MSEVFDIKSLEWKPVRPEVSHNVFAKTLLNGNVKAVLTRVAPGGKCNMHADAYAHLFYFLSGAGTVWVGKKQSEARSGVVVRVDSGEPHAYENTGTEDLLLVSLNIP
jgi:mannose-6-phosphate isomerase-like protein (cupin superfamily)